jgi:hypothetical protein
MISFKILEKTPECAKDKTHHYCDYIELLTLVDGGDGLSISDVYDRFHDDNKIDGIGTSDGAEVISSWEEEINNWFQELQARVSAYADKYPFIFKDKRFSLKENLTNHQLIYIGLLLCSSLRYIEGSSVRTLPSVFEYLSCSVMKTYLPSMAEVHIFGVSSRTQGRYHGSLEEKIRLLSEDASYPVSTRPNVFRDRDNGDGGVDIIAWLPYNGDINLDKKLLFIGQSASTMDWPNKQHSGERLLNYLNIETQILNTLYVPFDMRDIDRNIKEWHLVTTDVLFDRHRIINLLNPEDLFSESIGAEFKAIIDSAITFEESIV